MIVSQLDTRAVTPEHLIKNYESEMGYGFEITAADEAIEVPPEKILNAKLAQEVADEILKEVKIAICYCGTEDKVVAEPKKPVSAKAVEEVKDLKIFAKASEKPVEAKLIGKATELRIPMKYRMLKKLYHRLDNYIEKLTAKYDRISNATNDNSPSLKPLRVISQLLNNIDTVQNYFIDKIEEIEKRSGRDITIFDPALDKIDDIEEKLTHLKKELTKTLRVRKHKHVLRMNGDGALNCGF